MLPVTGPQLVGAHLPKDLEESKRIIISAVRGKRDLPQMPQYYLPYGAVTVDVKGKMISGKALLQRYPANLVSEQKAVIERALSKNGLRMDEVGFVPLRAKVQDLTVMVKQSDASIVDVLPINPWGNTLQ